MAEAPPGGDPGNQPGSQPGAGPEDVSGESPGDTGPVPLVGPPELAALDGLTQKWSPEEVAEIARWAQGHLIACPDLVWVGEAGTPQSWTSPADLAVVVSQTCDVVAEGPGARIPFVQVSPVIEASDVDEQLFKAIVDGEVVDRFALTPEGLAGRYMADLRISVPVDKRYLLGKTPVEGFPDELDLIRFSEHLATRLERPALHYFLTDVVVREVEKAVKKGLRSTESGWCSKVSEVCFLIQGSRLAPVDVRLLVLCDDPLTEEERQQWVDLNKQFVGSAKNDRGFRMSRPTVKTLEECRADMYRKAVPVRIPSLGPQRNLAGPQP